MSFRFRQLLLWRVACWGAILALLWIGGGPAYAQVDDTTDSGAQRELDVTPPAPLDSVQADSGSAPDTSSREKALVTADSLSALVRQGERLQELFSNVDVKQDTTRLRSNYALRYLERDELLFTGDVVIFERGDTLRADTVWYNKKTKVGRAYSNVRLTDGEVLVRAPQAIYYTDEKRSVFPDSVTLIDSARVLRAQEGTYWSNDRRADFSGNVHLTDPNTHLEADSLTYFRDQERSIASGSVFIRRVDTKKRRSVDSTSFAADSSIADTSVADTVSVVPDTTSGTADTSRIAVDTASVPVDTTAITYLFGEWADNQEQNRYSRVEQQALLVRVRMDSTGAPDDTLAVRAHRLEANRTDIYHRLVAVDSVRIWQADLAAVADSAVYDRVVSVGDPDSADASFPLPDTSASSPENVEPTYDSRLDSLVVHAELVGTEEYDLPPASPEGSPSDVTPDTTQPAPQPVRATAKADTTEPSASEDRPLAERRAASDSVATPDTSGARSSGPRTRATTRRSEWKTPSVQSPDNLPLEETRLFLNPVTWFERAQVWGDSIRVRAQNRSLDTVYVRRAAFAAQEDTTVDRIRQLKGRNITAFFQRDSLRRIRAWPNGQAIYFSASGNGELNGATRASADYAELYFRGEDVDRIKFGAGVQGTAYHKKEYIPDPFRLQGFQWTPERRPTRASLLREQRVRDRLDLGPPTQPPDDPQPPVAEVSTESRMPADSVAQQSENRADSTAGASEARRRAPAARQAQRRQQTARSDSTTTPADSLRTASDSSVPSDTTESSSSNP